MGVGGGGEPSEARESTEVRAGDDIMADLAAADWGPYPDLGWRSMILFCFIILRTWSINKCYLNSIIISFVLFYLISLKQLHNIYEVTIAKGFSKRTQTLEMLHTNFVKMLVPWRQVLVQVMDYESQQREKRLACLKEIMVR